MIFARRANRPLSFILLLFAGVSPVNLELSKLGQSYKMDWFLRDLVGFLKIGILGIVFGLREIKGAWVVV